MLRPDMTVTWLVFPIFVLIREIRRKNARVLGKFIPLFVLGVGAAVLPFFLYFLWADGLWDFYNAYLYFNFAYKDSTGSSLGAIVNAMYTFATLPVLLAASVVIFRCISGNRSLFDLAYLIYLPLSLVLAGISGRTAGHYSMVLVPVLAYPMGCLMAGYRRELFCRAAVTGLVLSLLATSWVYPLARTGDYLLHGISHPQNQNTLEAAAFIQETTDEDDRILVFGNKDILYLRSGRLSASKYSYQYPLANISEDIRREFYEQIRQAPPVLAIVEKEHDKTQRFDDDCYAYLESNQFVEVLSNELYTVYRQAGQEGA